jgi:hypothetical protein
VNSARSSGLRFVGGAIQTLTPGLFGKSEMCPSRGERSVR